MSRNQPPTPDGEHGLRELQLRARACRTNGNRRSAIMYEAQAEAILRQLANNDSSYLPALADTLMRQGMDWVGQKVLSGAEQKLRQAEKIYRSLARTNPGHIVDLANAVYRIGCLQGIRTGNDRIALPWYEQAFALFDRAAQRDPVYTELFHDAALALLELYEALGKRYKARKLRQKLGV